MPTAPDMSNAATFRRLHDATNSRDPELISRTVDEVIHPDALFHTAAATAAPAQQVVKHAWEVLLHAFPDIRVTIDDVISEADKVVFRNTVTGTHRGGYRGLQPTGRFITYSEIFIVRFAEGRVVEVWGVVDVFSQLQQLGAIRS